MPRAALGALLCLVCACTDDPGPGDGGAGSGGSASGSSGSGGSAGSGAPVAGSGGSAGGPVAGSGGLAGGAGTSAAGTGGSAGGGGTSAAGNAGAAGSGGAGSGGVAGGGGTAQSGGAAGAAGSTSGGTAGSAGGTGTFTLTSPAFASVEGCSVDTPGPCAIFPDENVSYEERPNISPELNWSGVPEGTQSFAIVLFDVSYGQAHWAIWNIPASVMMLAADVPKDTATPAMPAGSRQSNANFAPGGDGYFGPHIPCNVFQFEIYALSTSTFSPMDPDSAVLVRIELQELGDPVLGMATLIGRAGDYGMTCE